MLVTPKELQSIIEAKRTQGMLVVTELNAMRAFNENCGKFPVLKSYKPEKSPNAEIIDMVGPTIGMANIRNRS